MTDDIAVKISMVSAGASVLSSFVALVAVFYGPKKAAETAKHQIDSASYTARQQIIATTISANRQQWINTLRDAVSDLISIIHSAQARHGQQNDANVGDELGRKMIWSKAHIELLINPSESLHRLLVDQCELAICAFGERTENTATKKWITGPEAVADACLEITRTAQNILKVEWERVKSGK